MPPDVPPADVPPSRVPSLRTCTPAGCVAVAGRVRRLGKMSGEVPALPPATSHRGVRGSGGRGYPLGVGLSAQASDLAAKRDAATGAVRTRHEQALQRLPYDFAGELARIRIMDPACGSGNFLY